MPELTDTIQVTGAFNAAKFMVFLNFALYYRLLNFLDFITPKDIREKRTSFFNHAFNKVDARLDAQATGRKDFIHFAQRETKDGKPLMTREEMRMSMSTVMMAGSDTGVSTQ